MLLICPSLPHQAIIGALGDIRRNRVLSGLYMGRSDTQLVVRQASLHVWKIVVSNTPRTLREILPTLFKLLLGFLASTCPDKRTVRGRVPLHQSKRSSSSVFVISKTQPFTLTAEVFPLFSFNVLVYYRVPFSDIMMMIIIQQVLCSA